MEMNGVGFYEFYAVISVNSVSCFLSVAMSIHLCYSITRKMQRRLSMCYFISAMASTLALYNGALRYYTHFSQNYDLLQYKQTDIYGDTFSFVASTLFYIIAHLKMEQLLTDTVYAIHHHTSLAVTVTIALLILCCLLYIGATFHNFFHEHPTADSSYLGEIDLLIDPPVYCMVMLSCSLSIFLFALYVAKLRCLLRDEYELNAIELVPMTNDMIKHTVIFGMALLTNPMFYISLFMMSSFPQTIGWWMYVLRCLVNITNIIALWLCIRFNRKIYFNLCKSVHGLVRPCCGPMALSAAKRSHDEMRESMEQQIKSNSSEPDHNGKYSKYNAKDQNQWSMEFEPEVMKSTNLREMKMKDSTTGAVTPLNTELPNRHSLQLRNDLSPPQIPGLKDLVRFAMQGGKHHHNGYGYYKGEKVTQHSSRSHFTGSSTTTMPGIREHDNDSTSEEIPSMDIQHPYDGVDA